MAKGIAIPYIIAILLGIAVIGIIGYWFFFLGNEIGGEITVQDCNRKMSVYCSTWLATGYTGTPFVGGWDTYAKGCSNIGITAPDEAKCNSVLGRPAAPTGTPTPSPTPTGTPSPTAKVADALCNPDAPNNDGCPTACTAVGGGAVGRCS